MAKRTRTTITVREDNPVSRRHKQKYDARTVFVVLLLILFGWIFLSKNYRLAPQLARPAAASH
jgi:hypothetical protein